MDDKTLDCQLENFIEEKEKMTDIEEVSDIVFKKIIDKTFGFILTSLTSMFILVFLLPYFHKTCSKLHSLSELITFFLKTTGPGFLSMLMLVSVLFIGGAALFHSYRWGANLLKLVFTYWGLIILFEFRYSGFIMPKGKSGWTGFILTVFCFFIVLALSYLMYSKKKLILIRIMSFSSLVLCILNSGIILKFFYKLPIGSAGPDRHVLYIVLFFFAIIIMQMCTGLKYFMPGWIKAGE